MNKPIDPAAAADDAHWPDHLQHEAARIDAAAEARRPRSGRPGRHQLTASHRTCTWLARRPTSTTLPELAGTLRRARFCRRWRTAP